EDERAFVWPTLAFTFELAAMFGFLSKGKGVRAVPASRARALALPGLPVGARQIDAVVKLARMDSHWLSINIGLEQSRPCIIDLPGSNGLREAPAQPSPPCPFLRQRYWVDCIACATHPRQPSLRTTTTYTPINHPQPPHNPG